ncbi:hypothetical protein [Spirosoma jeollabukense]
MNISEEQKSIKIKIPVYVSELTEKPTGLFGAITQHEMIDKIKKNIDDFNREAIILKSKRKNKTFEKGIQGISYEEIKINTEPTLLLKITAFNTNYSDGYFEKDNKIEFTRESKIGSENNFVLIYPLIEGNDFHSFRYQWVILIYEDPNKESSDIISSAKIALSKILKIKIKNIKLKSALEAIEREETIPDVIIRVSSVDYDYESDMPIFRTYLVGSQTRIITESHYKDLPAESAINLISTSALKNVAFRAVKRFIKGKKEIKFTQYSNEEVGDSIKQMVEEIYNSETEITEEDLKNNIYNINFIMNTMQPVLFEYLSQIDGK